MPSVSGCALLFVARMLRCAPFCGPSPKTSVRKGKGGGNSRDLQIDVGRVDAEKGYGNHDRGTWARDVCAVHVRALLHKHDREPLVRQIIEQQDFGGAGIGELRDIDTDVGVEAGACLTEPNWGVQPCLYQSQRA